MALLDECPDGVVVLIRHGEVGIVPVHPVAKSNGLLRLKSSELKDTLFALFHERPDAVAFNVALGFEAKLLFDLDLDPEALAIEAILITQFVPGHRVIALKDVFISATPGVMHAHGIV